MWKKQLHSLPSYSSALLRRNRIPRPRSTAAAAATTPPSEVASEQNPLLEFASSSSNFRKFLLRGNPFSLNFSSSKVLHIRKFQLGLPIQTSNRFFSVSASTSPDSLKCWNCDGVPSDAAPFLVCQSCRCVQPVDISVDFFQILGVDRKYDIKVEDLEGKYKGWQKKLHPDLVHTKSQKERDYAAQQSARVTDAYRTLTDPLSRAIYILKLEGTEMDEEARISDPELLAEIMQIREAVEEAADAQALNHIQKQVQEKFEYCSEAFADAFEQRKTEEAVTSIQKMTYYKRAKEEITKKL